MFSFSKSSLSSRGISCFFEGSLSVFGFLCALTHKLPESDTLKPPFVLSIEYISQISSYSSAKF